MPDPIIIVAMVVLAALVESSPRRLVPVGAVLAVGVVLGSAHHDNVGVIALAGAVGVALASLGTAFEARRGRNRRGASPFATAQRDALRSRLSSSRTFARLSFVMAAIPGPTAKLLYPLLGAMRAPLLPAVVGTIIGRTIILDITTNIFAWLARALSTNDTGAAEFLVSLIVILIVLRALNWIDWQYHAQTKQWRLRENGADPLSARMFTGGVSGAGFDPTTSDAFNQSSRARVSDDEDDDDNILEGDVLGEEILDADDDAQSSQSAESDADTPSTGELPSGS